MKLNYRICPPKRLNHQEKQTMFELMSMNYDNSDFQRFSKDLDEKTAVILLEDEEKQIQGFSSYLIYGEREI
ncbi:MAG: hypothetical protein PF447_00565, partial [Spirochaetaceae bacterium]|nr:hypothetical protein [Spirochaetaceae bacterium]